MVTHTKRQCFNVLGLKQKLRICIQPEPGLGLALFDGVARVFVVNQA